MNDEATVIDLVNSGDNLEDQEDMDEIIEQILAELKALNKSIAQQEKKEAAQKAAEAAKEEEAAQKAAVAAKVDEAAQEEEAQKAQEEAEAKEAAQEEADQEQAETLQAISSNVQFHNELTITSFVLIGIITGILLFKVLWDRFKA